MNYKNQIWISLVIFFILNDFTFAQGRWKTYQYNDNILKVIFQPGGYHANENISDAVILKPVKKRTIPVKVSENDVEAGSKTKVFLRFHKTPDHQNGFSIKLSDNEKIYGGGERALPLNRRGYKFNLHNNPWYGYENGAENLNYSIPFFQSSKGYGLFFDNPSSGVADIGKTQPDLMNVTFSSGELNVYIIFGDSPQDILSQYHQLTGKQGLPPRWALGNFMSRFGYSSQEEVLTMAEKMESAQIPFDGVIIDLFWFGDSIKGTMGNLDWVNKKRWPDPESMIKKLREKNKNTILITEPFVLKSSKNYESSKRFHAIDSSGQPYVLQDFYFGRGGLIDIFRKDARDWFWAKHHQQNKIGVAAWWGDLGEPEKHPSDMLHNLSDMGYRRKFNANEVHNLYGHLWTKMLYQKYAIHYPDTRLFSLNRSGFAGSQRYNIIPWSGDVSRSWSGLKAQVPLMLGMSMSGIPYIHSDAGGFAGGNGDYELYIRWLQFSAFTPVLRPHGTALYELDPAAYSFPSEPALMPEPYKTMARKIILMRYQLLPYNYTLAYQQAKYGKPLVTPLYYSFPDDESIHHVEDQYMWGENIMVVPVTEKGVNSKTCILPKGKWFEFNTNRSKKNEALENSVTLPVDIDKPILFVKSGSFIPVIDKSGHSTSDFTTDTLTIHYFYGEDPSTYTLFDDDGKSKSSLKAKKYELIHFSAIPRRGDVDLKIRYSSGINMPKRKQPRHLKIVIHGNENLTHYSDVSNKLAKTRKVLINNEFAIDLNKNDITISLTSN